MSGPGQVAGAAGAVSDEDALRCLEGVLLAKGMPTAYVPEMREATVRRASSPGLVVGGYGGLEVARVLVAPRGRTYLVFMLQGGDEPRLMTVRTAEQAAATISGYRGSPPAAGAAAEG
ncbi:hypothetical protein Aple_050480 [Acrocarpospora pleiomorpha]|uniref:Uncharacterized protein n=1 Tax=Acrocarpospora pleiomorpha TaxID=90975 RepID=A0A5M3XRA4_9ACTN|nr:hypothetical protein [Acrocarpospora pleiomorpha]GES22151.1 hypothetical protein Aple_050480 [Acrocarpospora pleiomorpha]